MVSLSTLSARTFISVRIVCSPTLYIWCLLFCGVCIITSNSGMNTFVSPSSYKFRIISGWSDVRSFTSSTWIRSALTFAIVGASSFIASCVSLSISNPSWAAKRTARNILKASSLNLSWAQPTHFMICLFRSPIPSNSSTMPLLWLYAIAFIVKSRLSRSSFKFDVKVTSFGWRASSYSPSILYVVTS